MRLQRALRWTIFALTIYLLLSAALALFVAETTLHPGRRVLSAEDVAQAHDLAARTHADLTDVSIATNDGITLRAWNFHPENSNQSAVILLHGLSDNRLGMIGYAELLLRHGYTVLLPDSRAHGASGGDTATYGLLEREDIRRWFEWSLNNDHPHCIFGFAESMGAAQLIQSATETSFCSIAAESPFASFREIAYDRMGQFFHAGPWLGRTLLRPLVEFSFLYVRWKYGWDMNLISPEREARKARLPILLIHGRDDRNIPVRHSRTIAASNPNIALWEVPDTDHCGAISTHSEEFASRLTTWFQLNLMP
jgi:hypothetical protein